MISCAICLPLSFQSNLVYNRATQVHLIIASMSSESQYLRPERRREKRETTSGQVLLTFEDTQVTVPGVLMDMSPGGFRIKHTYQEISLNQVAQIEYSDGSRRARVAWNRRLAGEIETGFMIID
jgi:hypothetical protein